MNRLVIDTDPGVDDARAMMLAFAHPDTKVEAITVVAGNVDLDLTLKNACTVLDILGVPREQTPVFAGCDRALLGQRVKSTHIQGTDGLGDSNHAPSPRQIEAEHAALALIRLANAFPGELTLVAIAPLTNIALATRLDPALPNKYKRLVVMGGAVRGRGNMYDPAGQRHFPSAEFNIHSDPEAAAIVFENWHGLWQISWETTLKYLIPGERVEELMNINTARAEFFARITRNGLRAMRERLSRDAISAPDELAMAVAVEPEIVTRAETHAVAVELMGTHTRGETTVDWADRTGRPRNVNIVLELEQGRFWQLMQASVG